MGREVPSLLPLSLVNPPPVSFVVFPPVSSLESSFPFEVPFKKSYVHPCGFTSPVAHVVEPILPLDGSSHQCSFHEVLQVPHTHLGGAIHATTPVQNKESLVCVCVCHVLFLRVESARGETVR